ncbi:MAG: saccharopine dehydrogenase C-terminal domain-containing protein [Gemmatimonadota bacterium]|jgi:lysine 6-dehydrogenase
MADVIVLGAGRVGAAMALDLAADPSVEVTAADASEGALERLSRTADRRGVAVATRAADLSTERGVRAALAGADLAIGAVPGPMGYRTVERVLGAGVDVVDISFFEEDAYDLDALARREGRVAVVDAGVAPGLSNLVLGDLEARLRRVDRFECLVGGIPADPRPPWEYKAPFSPIDVIAEYTRPARLRRGGTDLTMPALSEVEALDFPGVGRLEAFNTDGLRTLLRTSAVPDLVEKTLRWPGHADRIRVLRETGFFAGSPVPVGDAEVVPLELSAALLFDAWRYAPGEADLTAMRIVVEGEDGEGPVRHELRLIDRYDAATDTASMARTTGYTATALARLVLDGTYREPGVSPPERIGARAGTLDRVLDDLERRGVRVARAVTRP